MTPIYLIAGIGLFSAIIITMSLIAFSWRWRLVDYPGGRKQHRNPVPLCGGIAIYLSFVLTLGLSGLLFSAEGTTLAAGGGVLLAVGLVDDLKSRSARWLFFLQAGVVGAVLIGLGDIRLLSLGDLTGSGKLLLGGLSVPVTLFCLVGVINALNMIDGQDGLAGGVSLIALAGMAGLGLASSQVSIPLMALMMSACVLGFLAWNFPWFKATEAKVFLGNSGSLFLGAMLGAFAVLLTQGYSPVMRPITAVWLLGLPIADTLRVMARRAIMGHSPFAPGRDHLHHLLQGLGMSGRATVATLLVIATGFALVGIGGELLNIGEAYMLLAALCIFALIVIFAEVTVFFIRQADRQAAAQVEDGPEAPGLPDPVVSQARFSLPQHGNGGT